MTGDAADELRTLLTSGSDARRVGWLYENAAAVLALIEAAQARVKYGPNDTCANELNPDYDCSCSHAALAAAVSRLTEPQT